MRKLLVERKKGKYFSKGIEVVDIPSKLLPALNRTAIKILSEIADKPNYPKEIAKKLGIDRQKVYYHIHKLEKSGLIKVVKETKKGGAMCKFYSPVSHAFGFELSLVEKEVRLEEVQKVREFFEEFVGSGIFNGLIVVGSPVPHGPFLTAARDGHCAVQLAFFLGNLCELPKEDIVKLDTEVRAEHEEKNNMILIGGPITNMVSSEINEKLKIKFVWKEFWKVFSEISKKEYADEDLGIIAKVKSPWDETKKIIMLAGLKFEGTKACILAITNFSEKLLKNYKRGQEFFALIKGFDRNGDGKIDDIKIIETSE
jgi:DNA-binding transcriptional ArsR family regulator